MATRTGAPLERYILRHTQNEGVNPIANNHRPFRPFYQWLLEAGSNGATVVSDGLSPIDHEAKRILGPEGAVVTPTGAPMERLILRPTQSDGVNPIANNHRPFRPFYQWLLRSLLITGSKIGISSPEHTCRNFVIIFLVQDMLSTIESFAQLLDAARYDQAAHLLSSDCEYHYGDAHYTGPVAIANIWQQNHKQSAELFDEIRYETEIEALDEATYKLTLIDSFRLGDHWHDSRSFDLVTVEEDVITDIEHHELLGEAERFRAFYLANRNVRT